MASYRTKCVLPLEGFSRLFSFISFVCIYLQSKYPCPELQRLPQSASPSSIHCTLGSIFAVVQSCRKKKVQMSSTEKLSENAELCTSSPAGSDFETTTALFKFSSVDVSGYYLREVHMFSKTTFEIFPISPEPVEAHPVQAQQLLGLLWDRDFTVTPYYPGFRVSVAMYSRSILFWNSSPMVCGFLPGIH